MKYSIKTGAVTELNSDAIVCDATTASKIAKQADQADLYAAALADFKNKPGQTLLVHLPEPTKINRLLVVGGLDSNLSKTEFRSCVQAAATRLHGLPIMQAIWTCHLAKVKGADLAWKCSNALAAVAQKFYTFGEHKTKSVPKPSTLSNLVLVGDAKSRSALMQLAKRAVALEEGLQFARDLGNQPPNVCHPTYLHEEAKRLATAAKVKVSALDEKRMTSLGMGAFMSVSQGSDQPGKMIIIEYNGGPASKKPVVLVGKGITFDTGGISLKPGAGMDEMKFDMCGAASVLGATKAAIEAKLPINLVCIVAAAENMPSGDASRPGDIVTTMSGQTVEILNTDAEGRLVLCDALTYAKKFDPEVVVDVATLTGAVIVALGSKASAVYSNDDRFASELIEAGEYTGDRAWQMPLWEEYQPQLKSNFADMANIGGREAGSITAACFLSRYVDEMTWAHMDVAGTAFKGGGAKGATGRPVGLLFRFLCERAARKAAPKRRAKKA